MMHSVLRKRGSQVIEALILIAILGAIAVGSMSRVEVSVGSKTNAVSDRINGFIN